MNKNELKTKKKDDLIHIIWELRDRLEYITGQNDGTINVVDLEEEKDKHIHETCEAIRDQFIYKNGTKEYDCNYDISSKRLNSFLCELDGVEDDWKDEN